MAKNLPVWLLSLPCQALWSSPSWIATSLQIASFFTMDTTLGLDGVKISQEIDIENHWNLEGWIEKWTLKSPVTHKLIL